jgi:hypothetical protein
VAPGPPIVVPTVVPTPTPPLDADGDGFPAALECNDNNAAIKPGAFDVPGNGVDEDCNGTDAPLQTMSLSVSWDHSAFAKYTTFSRMTVTNIPRGADVTVTCKGKACPKRATFRRVASGSVNLRTFVRRKKFRVNNTIEVRVTAEGYRGSVKTLKIRSRKKPTVTTRCLAPGATRPTACS